jgi:hypothetical protein
MRAVIVASQVLFLDYDRAHTGLREEPAIEEDAQSEAEQPAKSKRSRRKQTAWHIVGAPGMRNRSRFSFPHCHC